MKAPGWLRVDVPPCERIVGDPVVEYCLTHRAYWPLRDRACRTARAARRQGKVLVRVTPRRWHPGFWLTAARALLRGVAAKP